MRNRCGSWVLRRMTIGEDVGLACAEEVARVAVDVDVDFDLPCC